MNNEIENLFDIAEDIMLKALEDLRDPDHLELLTYWGDILDGLCAEGHKEIVGESVIILTDTLEMFLDNYEILRMSLSNIDLEIDDERYKFIEPLCQVFMGIFLEKFKNNTGDDRFNNEQKEAIQLTTALCINYILNIISESVKKQTHGVLNEIANIRLPDVDRMRDRESSIRFISDVAYGKTKTNINVSNLGRIFLDNEDDVIKFINSRLEILSDIKNLKLKQTDINVQNKILIRTYKTLLYNFEQKKEEANVNELIYGYPPLIVLHDTMSYLLEQLNKINNVKIKSWANEYVQDEYLTCRKFILETWSKNILKSYKISVESATN